MNSHAKPRSREEKAKNPGNFLLLNSSATSREKQTSIQITTNNFNQGTKSPMNIEELSAVVVDCAYKLHVEAGPGLLETVSEVVLAIQLFISRSKAGRKYNKLGVMGKYMMLNKGKKMGADFKRRA